MLAPRDRTVSGSLALILGGSLLGALLGGGYATLCAAVWRILHGTFAEFPAAGSWAAVSGALAGGLMGLCRALDRTDNRVKGLPSSSPRLNERLFASSPSHSRRKSRWV